MAVSWRQDKFAFRNDDGSETTATYTSGCANYTIPIYGDRNIRVRLAVTEQGSTAAALTPWLKIQKDGAGGYYSASACSGSGIYPYASGNFADDAATTVQINPVTFVAGTMDEADGKCGATASIARYSGTEAEYNLRISASIVSNATYFDFRVYNSDVALNTYSLTGRLTIAKWAGINAAAQAETVENCSITYHAAPVTLTIQNVGQAETVANAVLTAHYTLSAIQNSEELQTVENTALTAHYTISAIQNSEELQTVENTALTALTAHYILSSIQDSEELQTVENATITYHPAVVELPLRAAGSRHYYSMSTRMWWDNIHNLAGHDMSISIWFDMTSMSDWQTFLVALAKNDDSPGIFVDIPSPGNIEFRRPSDYGTQTVSATSDDLVPNEWINLIITSTGDGVATNTHIYVNGTEASYSTQTDMGGAEKSLGGKWVAGMDWYSSCSSGLYYAWLGELAVWDRVLTGTEIDELTDWGAPQSAMNYDTNLLFCYHPDEPMDLVTELYPTYVSTHTDEGPDLEFPEVPIEPITLTIQDSDEAETVENAVITYHPPYFSISIQNAEDLQSVQNAVLTAHIPNFSMAFQDALQAQTAESKALTQHQILTGQAAAQSQTVENAILTAHVPTYTVTIANTSQAQTVGNTVLTGHIPTFILTLQDTYQVQIVDNVILFIPVTTWVLTVQDVEQLQYADNLYVGPVIYPPDIFVGYITYPQISVTKETIDKNLSTVLKTSPTIQRVKSEVEVKKAY